VCVVESVPAASLHTGCRGHGEPTPDQRPRRVGGCSQGPRSWRESAGPHVVGERCGRQWLRHFGTGHERAGTMSTDELSGVGEFVHGFAQRHPGDLETRGEFAFGGQWIAGVHVVDQLREQFTNVWHPQPNLRLVVYTISTAVGTYVSTSVEPVAHQSPTSRRPSSYRGCIATPHGNQTHVSPGGRDVLTAAARGHGRQRAIIDSCA